MNKHIIRKKAFTLIELLIAIVIIGILSTLLFRTLSEIIRTSSRVQQEKILAQEFMTIQNSINSLSEYYPYLDQDKYKENSSINQGFVSTLYLKNSSGDKISISGTGDCSEECFLTAQINNDEPLVLTNPKLSKVGNILFKILPIQHYTTDQYEEQFKRENISYPGFWILGNLSNNLKNGHISKVSYSLQHFVNLKIEQPNEVKENIPGETENPVSETVDTP